MPERVMTKPGAPRLLAPPPVLFSVRFPFGRGMRFIFAFLVLFVFFLSIVSMAFGQPELSFMAIYAAEGLVESLGAMFCLLAAIIFFTCYQTGRLWPVEPVEPGRPARVGFYFVLAVLMFVMFGEEVGWGSRLTAWLTNTLAHNAEFSISKSVQPAKSSTNIVMVYWAGIVITYTCLLPFLVKLSPGFAKFVGSARLPMPSRYLAGLGTLAVLMSARLSFDPTDLSLRADDVDEAFETSLEALLFAWSLEEYRWIRLASARPVSRFLATAFAGIIVATFFASMYDMSTRGYPLSRSQKLLQQGVAAAQRKEEETAIKFYQEAIEAYPYNDAARYALGQMLDSRGRLAEAVPHFEWAVRVAPQSVDYQLALALAYVNLWTGPSLRAAIPHLDESIRLMSPDDPRRPELLQLRNNVVIFKKAGEHAASIPELRARVEKWKEERSQKLESGNSTSP